MSENIVMGGGGGVGLGVAKCREDDIIQRVIRSMSCSILEGYKKCIRNFR
jgi:hypothetical protein